MVRTAFAALLLVMSTFSPALAQADGPDVDDLEKRAKAAPSEVAAFITRNIECWHWSGEDGESAERRKEIIKNVKRLRCDALSKDAESLKTRYPSPEVVKLLNDAQTSLR